MIFVSYSRINNKSDDCVVKLVNKLRGLGYNVEMDEMIIQEKSSINFTEMMSKSLKTAEKVIVVLSESYKIKADSFLGGVGEEYRYIISDIKANDNKYILVSFDSNFTTCLDKILPDYLKERQVLYVDLNDVESSELMYKLSGVKKIIFTDVNTSKYIPKCHSVSKKTDDDCIFRKSEFDYINDSTIFFDSRIRDAFPGVRGLKIFDNPVECVERLSILLKPPLYIKSLTDPIWYFRGHSCLQINSFAIINKNKVLLGHDEYIIDKIGVYINPDMYYRDFVYVQTKPDMTCGVYGYDNVDDGYEEFGIVGDRFITRAEYDDGSAVIDGIVVQVDDKAELRTRHLLPYNFILCAKFNPVNSSLGDEITQKYCEGILRGELTLDDLVKKIEKLTRREIFKG